MPTPKPPNRHAPRRRFRGHVPGTIPEPRTEESRKMRILDGVAEIGGMVQTYTDALRPPGHQVTTVMSVGLHAYRDQRYNVFVGRDVKRVDWHKLAARLARNQPFEKPWSDCKSSLDRLHHL